LTGWGSPRTVFPTMSIDKVFIAEDGSSAPINLAADLPTLGMRYPRADGHFHRNHFAPPPVDPDTWALALGGALSEPMVIPADSLRTFEHRTLPVVLECAGHRRAELHPPARGLPWGTGAVSEAMWAPPNETSPRRGSGTFRKRGF